MKFTKLVLVTLSIVLSYTSSFRLSVFGDPGQFDQLFPLAIPSPLQSGTKVPSRFTPQTSEDCKINGQEINKMSNWERVVKAMKEKINESDQTVILGDMVYPESKFASVKFSKGYWISLQDGQDPEKYWRERLRCAWDGFFVSTKTVLKDVKAFEALNGNKFSKKFQIIPGNHLYDINPQDEVRYMHDISAEEDETFTWYPKGSDWLNGVRLQRIEEKEQVIFFLDFNSAVFEAVSNKYDFIYDGRSENILDQIQKNLLDSWWNLSGVTKEDVFSTLEGVFEALEAMEKETSTKAVIRILRAHHPPFNVEGDVTGMFQYKSKLNGLTLLEACRKAKVNFYFASHHHSGQIWAYEYAKVSNLTGKGLRQPQDNFKLNGIRDPSRNYDCFPLDCAEYSLKSGIKLNDQKFLYIILIGNSGRYFDPLNPDTNSYGTLLYARARNDNPNKSIMDRWKTNHAGNFFGGAVANFSTVNSSTTVTVDFYEAVDGNAQRTASLNLTSGSSQDINDFASHAPNNRLKKRFF